MSLTCGHTPLVLVAALACTKAPRPVATPAPATYFGDWPAGISPREIGTRVARNYLARAFPTSAVHYKEACTRYGALAFARVARDTALDADLVRRFDPLLTATGAALVPERAHVDDRVFGIVPLELYIHGGAQRYLAMGKSLADMQWASTTPDGISSEARYWVDDMWMITALQTQAFRATNDAVYLDRAARTMAAYLDRLQQPNGLFFHTARSPEFWGRGNGWFAAGMAELLRALPANHPQRARIMDGYQKKMMAGRRRRRGRCGSRRPGEVLSRSGTDRGRLPRPGSHAVERLRPA